MEDRRFLFRSEENGVRIDVYLSSRLSISRSKAKEILERGLVKVGERSVKPSFKVKRGLLIEGLIPEEEDTSVEPEDIPLNILYEDDYLLFIDKPSGMVVHPSFGHKKGTLVNAILAYLKRSVTKGGDLRPGIVHRLDKDTTGVILYAKDEPTQRKLQEMFKERKVKKVYRTIVLGEVKGNEGSIRTLIGRSPKNRKKMAVLSTSGREAVTYYRVLSRLDGFTYLEVYPITGRTHQIRVHLSHIGHPIVGDPLYGRRAKALAERPLLHAFSLELQHPVTSEFLSVISSLPEDMQEFLRSHR